MRYLLISLCIIGLFSIAHESSALMSKNPALEKLFADIKKYEGSIATFGDISRGKHPRNFPHQTWEAFQNQLQQYKAFQQQLAAFLDEDLSRQDQISKAIMQMKLADEISLIQYKAVLIPFNAEGGFFNTLTYFLANLPFNNEEDYETYLKWLPDYGTFIQENQELMRLGIKEKVVAPKVIVRNMQKLMKPWLEENFEKSPLAAPFLNMPASISTEKQIELRKKGEQLIIEKMLPIYQDLAKFVEKKYLPQATSQVGISNVPQGKAYYANRVKHYTTLDISPDSVFNLGMQEVKRIRKAMDQVIQDLKFEGSFADFLEFLRTDKQFYPNSAQALIRYASWLSKQAEGQLPKFFSKLYSLPFTVEPVPDEIAPTYTTGRYVRGDYERKRPGIYWVNTYQLTSRTLYTMPALTLHEAVPGHHLQIALASELKGQPYFRKSYYISAFGEGWGLYSEYLGEEMGMYTTPYELFGRYTYEMWRACRLVVDVGMHDKGWTREQALKFMAENTALSIHEVNTEIDRYIGWPGQALSYKMGEIKIKSLREKAQKILGDKFDIQAFHHAVLKNGAVPLSILEEEVNDYIQAER